jgi:hypothetical protein
MFPFTTQETIFITAISGLVVGFYLVLTGLAEMIKKRFGKS